jgi:hypothetical protein
MRMGNISSGVPRPDEFQFSDVREMLLRSRKTRPRLNAVAVASLQRRRYLPALCRVQALAVPAIGALTHIDDDDRHSPHALSGWRQMRPLLRAQLVADFVVNVPRQRTGLPGRLYELRRCPDSVYATPTLRNAQNLSKWWPGH